MASKQQSLGIKVPRKIDLAKFVTLTMIDAGEKWTVQGMPPGRRAAEVGKHIATIGFHHNPGYEVILEFPDGKIDSFNPQNLRPAN